MSHETQTPAAGRMRAWLEILRVPNLPTVPGDPLAGVLLAAAAAGGAVPWGAAALAAAASLLLYGAGLLLNDVVDLEEDRRDRPHRPLPSGRLPVRSALRAALAFTGLGLAAAFAASPRAGLVGIALASHVFAYNYLLKRTRLGPLVLGMCRGLSLALGACAVLPAPPPGVLAAAGVLVLYVAVVSQLARGETAVPGRPRLVGRLLGALPLLQAAFALASRRTEAPAVAVALVLAGLASAALRRRFAAS